jgi:hypothetical protein
MRFIGVCPLGSPTHTAVVICGVPPTNHALVLSSCVPVLPVAGREKLRRLRAPVPDRMTPFSVSTVAFATP